MIVDNYAYQILRFKHFCQEMAGILNIIEITIGRGYFSIRTMQDDITEGQTCLVCRFSAPAIMDLYQVH